jgi:RNA polymerase sigma-70 factor (ECF subfamily)
MNAYPTDVELLARSVTEPSVFGELYERHGRAVWRYVVRRIGDDAGEDLAADVFVRAFRARGRYRPDRGTALPWLLGIANHVIADHRRLERRRLAALARFAGDGQGRTDQNGAALDPQLVTALRRLPAVERDTLLLVVWGELTQDEAAAALGVPVGTVSSRITRARKRLAAVLQAPVPALTVGLQPQGDTHA